jgi:CBS domain-containing protein
MERDLTRTSIHAFPYAFVSKRGDPILVTTLSADRAADLLAMYLAYEPRGSFQGLPPTRDDLCRKWVDDMIANGLSLVALSFLRGVVGHVALFPVGAEACEMLVVVSPPHQNAGIGTELVRCSTQVSHELGFEQIHLSVESANGRARHVYKKCGFEYVAGVEMSGDIEMVAHLRRHRDTVNASVSAVMNREVISFRPHDPCTVALDIFLRASVASLPVVDDRGRLLGILSKSDLMLSSNLRRNVGEVLTRDVITVAEAAPIEKVLRILQSKRVRAVPVVDRDNKLVGVVGRRDILAYYSKNLDRKS